jgi:hypothetical protein
LNTLVATGKRIIISGLLPCYRSYSCLAALNEFLKKIAKTGISLFVTILTHCGSNRHSLKEKAFTLTAEVPGLSPST